MKRFFSGILISLAIIVCIGLVGCGGKDNPPDSNLDNEIVEPSQPEKPTEPEGPINPDNPPDEEPPIDEEPNDSMLEKFKVLADEILLGISLSYDIGEEYELVVKNQITNDKLEIIIDFEDTELSDEDLFQEAFEDIKDIITNLVDKSEIDNLHLDCQVKNFKVKILITPIIEPAPRKGE